MNPLLPPDRQDVGEIPSDDIIDEVIALADEAGLAYSGELDEDDKPIFTGTKQQREAFEQKLLEENINY